MADPKFHRCSKHAHIGAVNLAAKSDPELGVHDAECGACIAYQVWWIRHHQLLPILETVADLFVHHAKLRARVTQLETQLTLLGGTLHHES